MYNKLRRTWERENVIYKIQLSREISSFSVRVFFVVEKPFDWVKTKAESFTSSCFQKYTECVKKNPGVV